MKNTRKTGGFLALLLTFSLLLAEVPFGFGNSVKAVEEAQNTQAPTADVTTVKVEELNISAEDYYERYVSDGLVGLYTAFSEEDADIAGGVWKNKKGGGDAVLHGARYWESEGFGIGYRMTLAEWKSDGTSVGISLPERFADMSTFYTEIFATVVGITDENGDRLVNSYSAAVKDETGAVISPAVGSQYGYYKNGCSAFRFELISTLFFCSLDDKKDSASLGQRWYLYNAGYPGSYPPAEFSEYFRSDPSNYETSWRTAGPEDVPTPLQMRVAKQTAGASVTYSYSYTNGHGAALTIGTDRQKVLLGIESKDVAGRFSLFNALPSTVYAIRVYDRMLREDEILLNAFIDKAAYYRLDLSKYDTMSDADKASLHAAFDNLGFSEEREYVTALYDYFSEGDSVTILSRLVTFAECRPVLCDNGGYRVIFAVDKVLYEFLTSGGFDVRYGALVADGDVVLRNEDMTLENGYTHKVAVGGVGGSEVYFEPVSQGKYCFSVAITASDPDNLTRPVRVRGYVSATAKDGRADAVYTDAFSAAMPQGGGSIADVTEYFVNRYSDDMALSYEYFNSAVLRRVLALSDVPVKDAPEHVVSLYVDAVNGSNRNSGRSPSEAYKSVAFAFAEAKEILATPGKKIIDIRLSEGTHTVNSPLTLAGEEILASEYSLRIIGAGEKTVLTSEKEIACEVLGTDVKTGASYFRLPMMDDGSYPDIRALYGDGALLRLAHAGDSEHVEKIQGFRIEDANGKKLSPLGNDWQLSAEDAAWAKYGIFSFSSDMFEGDLADYRGAELHIGVVWTSHVLHIDHVKSVGDGKVDVYVLYGALPVLNKAHSFDQRGAWIENAKTLLNVNDDTYYYDRKTGTVYYKEGAYALSDYASLSYATAETMFLLSDVENVTISDLTVTGLDSRYIKPDATAALGQAAGLTLYESLSGGKTSVGFMKAAAVYGTNVENLRVERITVRDTLGAGVVLDGIVDGVIIDSSAFLNLGEAAIRLGGGAYRSNSYVRGAQITNNYVKSIGTLYKAAVGIQLNTAADCRVIGNTVIDVPYSAFSVGWIWATVSTSATDIVGGAMYCTYNTEIAYNYVTDFMTCMGDGGAFYLLGGNVSRSLADTTPYNFMHHNYVNVSEESGKHEGHPIAGARHIMCYYHDNSSSNWHDYENVLINTTLGDDLFYGAFHQSTADCEAQNNRQTDNYFIGFDSLLDVYRNNKGMLSINTAFGINGADYVYSDVLSLVRNNAVPATTVEGFSSKSSRLDAATAVASIFAASGSSLYRTTMVSGLTFTASAQERVLVTLGDAIGVEGLIPSLSVTLSSPKASPGDTVLVPVYAKQESGAGGRFEVYFHEDVAAFVSFEAADGVTVQRTKEGLSVTLTAKPVVGRAVLTLKMHISQTCPAGTHTYLTCYAEDGEEVAVASVRIYAKGDVTMDGRVDSADVLAIEKHLVKLASLSAVQVIYADVNGDGKADARDAMRILQMIASSSN